MRGKPIAHIQRTRPVANGEQQMNSLADLIQASLMLNYHGRTVG